MIGADTTFLVQLEVVELPANSVAHALLQREILATGVELALVPQVLAEFIHVVTDARRFQHPLGMAQAIARARFWWNAQEVCQLFPDSTSTQLALDWLARYQLGRKRILDTQLGAILWNAGVRRIITANPTDFAVFGFDVISA